MPKKNGRPPSPGTTLGWFLEERGISHADAARCLGVTRAHVSLIARGGATPSLRLSYRIRDWAASLGGYVPVDSWERAAG